MKTIKNKKLIFFNNKKKNKINKKSKINKKNKESFISRMEYKEHVSEPWYSLIALGIKVVEGRKNKGRFKEMKVGDIIEWNNNDFNPRSCKTIITGKKEYNTFREYLEKEGLSKCLPSISNIEDGLSVYFKYFTKEDEKEFGVVAIRLKVL